MFPALSFFTSFEASATIIHQLLTWNDMIYCTVGVCNSIKNWGFLNKSIRFLMLNFYCSFCQLIHSVNLIHSQAFNKDPIIRTSCTCLQYNFEIKYSAHE
ncbi:uncharacterized protein LOC115221517 [Octopus sinensis]|uniref:Uncharacterized protein LOC115221517 n=1 Tax=Octopus sinensis TaxID=2607531 RepID=A0A7E6FH85_9MOLL|nr:uncharacterized protein LOC115221517 [Octopus sinensis]